MEVVIIEDDKETREYISLVLKTAWPNVDIDSTSFGGEGIDLVKEKSPQIVILDLGLPDINGFIVLQRLRSFSKVPVLVLTINGIPQSKAKSLSLGADCYMNKPFEANELIVQIEQILKKTENNSGIAY